MKPMRVEVEFASVAPNVVGVNGNAEPEPPQALPVFEMRPVAEKVAQPAAPPAPETMRFVVEAVPVLEIWKSVDCADAVEEPIMKSA